jgi:hypothetical protein
MHQSDDLGLGGASSRLSPTAVIIGSVPEWPHVAADAPIC